MPSVFKRSLSRYRKGLLQVDKPKSEEHGDKAVESCESVRPKPYFVDELQRTKETLADLGVAFA